MSSPRAEPLPRISRVQWVALAAILLVAFALRLNHLGHVDVKDLDEVFHAIVARNLALHPLTPTLYDVPYLPYDFRNWQANHVWLHKPPVALWQMAVSIGVFDDSTFAMRLPSLIGSVVAVALTFAIGRQLGDARAGLVAAALQAMSPFVTRLTHGQVFSDHVDVALLAWCELAVWLTLVAARSGRLSHAIFAGVAQGVAWLTKSHPALFVTGLAALLWIVPRLLEGGSPPPPREPEAPALASQSHALQGRQLIAFLAAAILTALPWTLWCAIRFPREFAYEQGHVVRHLYENVEQFAAPWDRLLFDYLHRGLLEWWPLAVVSVGLLAIDAIRRRHVARGFVAAWALGVLVPHLLATSKTPSATLIGWPAAWLAIGFVVSDATRGRRSALAAVVVAGVMVAVWRQVPGESVMGYGPDYRFGRIALAHWPLVVQVGAIAVAAAIASFLSGTGIPAGVEPYSARSDSGCAGTQTGMSVPLKHWPAALACVALLVPTIRHASLAYRTSADVDGTPLAFAELAKIVRRQSPPTAVFLVDDQVRNEHLVAMWWLDRACYPLRDATYADDVRAILDHGGTPFVLSRRGWRDATPVIRVAGEGAIYRVDR